MKRQIILFIVLIMSALTMFAEDSIKVSAADLQALIRRVEALEKKDSISQQMVTGDVIGDGTRRKHGH